MSLALVSLDELAADPARTKDLAPEVAQVLLAQVVGLQTVLLVRALSLPAGGNGQPDDGDRLLDVRQAAAKLQVSRDWLYRRAPKLPFTVRLGSRLRFSERGIQRWVRQRQGQ